MFTDDFFGVNSLFEKMWNNFSRPIADQYPFKAYKKDNGYLIVCNTLGLGKEDVKVELERKKGSAYPILKVTGETQLENINFSNKVNLGILLRQLPEEEIDSIKYDVKNGITSIFVKSKEPKTKTITAEYADNGLDF